MTPIPCCACIYWSQDCACVTVSWIHAHTSVIKLRRILQDIAKLGHNEKQDCVATFGPSTSQSPARITDSKVMNISLRTVHPGKTRSSNIRCHFLQPRKVNCNAWHKWLLILYTTRNIFLAFRVHFLTTCISLWFHLSDFIFFILYFCKPACMIQNISGRKQICQKWISV